ncbi:hydroxypyruvate isomerase family protein [Leadbetterella sp. DM7]|uniref:hydroxypyruvate isomerase family protein n=1 Tax=Leadbetterella sp. DM7 TaxID=3235085 RepID=UPI00349EC4D1
MNSRRSFLKSTITTTSLLGIGGIPLVSHAREAVAEKYNFNLSYAPHFGMFRESAGEDLIAQLDFMAASGFRSFEDNGMMDRTPDLQKKIGEHLAKRNMEMGVFVIDAGDNWKTSLTTGKKEFTDAFLKRCREAVEVAKRVNGKYMTVVPGYFARELPPGIQTGNVIEAYKRAAEIFEPHGLVMVMEPLSDNPDLFLRHSDQGYMICKAVGSPACKILFDIYHMQKNEGRLIQHIDWAWDEIAYFQIGDEPGRKEPTTGEINYKNVFKHVYQKGKASGRSFIFGMEHGNFGKGIEGEKAVIRAYQEVDKFL